VAEVIYENMNYSTLEKKI